MKEFSYRLNVKALNSVKLLPNPGKKLSEEELSDIETLITDANEKLSVRREGTGLYIISTDFGLRNGDIEAMVEECVPKKLTQKQLKEAESRAKREQAKKEQDERISNDIGSEAKAAEWVEKTFGKAEMNNYNKAALINYITGKEKTFKGMFNRLAGEIAYQIGAVKDGYYDYPVIKQKFETETA